MRRTDVVSDLADGPGPALGELLQSRDKMS